MKSYIKGTGNEQCDLNRDLYINRIDFETLLPLSLFASTSFTLAPLSSKTDIMLARSCSAASCNGVLFFLSGALTFAPARIYKNQAKTATLLLQVTLG